MKARNLTRVKTVRCANCQAALTRNQIADTTKDGRTTYHFCGRCVRQFSRNEDMKADAAWLGHTF